MGKSDIPGDHRLGVPEIDAEHALQMSVVGAFRSAGERQDSDTQRVIFDRLVDYSTAHFMAEALLMRLHEYPDTEAHLLEHKKLLDELALIRDSLDGSTGLSLADRLDRWFDTHLRSYDHPFILFLAEVNAHDLDRSDDR